MPLLLHVPYVQKEEAKKRGARWSAEHKTWYAPTPQHIVGLRQWMGTDPTHSVILHNQLHVFKGRVRCKHCAHMSAVYALASADFTSLNGDACVHWNKGLVFFTALAPLTPALSAYFAHKIPGFSARGVISKLSLASCEHCGMYLGAPDAPGSPLVLEQARDARDLEDEIVSLRWDVPLDVFDFWYPQEAAPWYLLAQRIKGPTL